ncbi:MAG: hypothetical protein OXL40_05520 [Bacteroidota bacterium]|nr:hypothetical protein [Bacteroidota bacterium]
MSLSVEPFLARRTVSADLHDGLDDHRSRLDLLHARQPMHSVLAFIVRRFCVWQHDITTLYGLFVANPDVGHKVGHTTT